MVIHWTSASEAPRSFWMAGLAIATMVPSSATIITPIATEKSVSQGWPRRPLVAAGADEGSGALSALSTVV